MTKESKGIFLGETSEADSKRFWDEVNEAHKAKQEVSNLPMFGAEETIHISKKTYYILMRFWHGEEVTQDDHDHMTATTKWAQSDR